MELVLEPSLMLSEFDCCVIDCSFCGVDGDGSCGVDIW